MKIKTTKKGNVQITMSEAHAKALSHILGGTSRGSRGSAIAVHLKSPSFVPWTEEHDALVYEIGSLLRAEGLFGNVILR